MSLNNTQVHPSTVLGVTSCFVLKYKTHANKRDVSFKRDMVVLQTYKQDVSRQGAYQLGSLQSGQYSRKNFSPMNFFEHVLDPYLDMIYIAVNMD